MQEERIKIGEATLALMPCQDLMLSRSASRAACDTEQRHFHILMSREDGTAFLPARISSKPFLRILLVFMRAKDYLDSAEEEKALLALGEPCQLLEELTGEEVLLLESGLGQCTQHGYWGV